MWNTNFLFPIHEPEPYVRTTATNGDHNATAETQTAATARTVPGADENDDDPDDEYEYVKTETDNNMQSKKSHSYNIHKLLLNLTIVGRDRYNSNFGRLRKI